MAPVYADHPFQLIETPIFAAKSKDASYKPDMFDDIASEMALVHNMVIRGLNSIYLQAPHIQPADEKAFCRYISGWYNTLHSHHAGEEAMFFPWIEEKTGVQGLMDTNREQHKAFHDAMDDLNAYANDVIADKAKYDGNQVVVKIDGFAESLIQHLRDEIPSIIGLRQYGDKLAGMDKMFAEEAEKAMKEIGTAGMVWAFANLDQHYEKDMWLSFPPAPAPVKFLFRSVFWFMNTDYRKFGSADRAGNLRALYAVPASA